MTMDLYPNGEEENCCQRKGAKEAVQIFII